VNRTQFALIESILPRLSDEELQNLIERAQFMLVRRILPPKLAVMPKPTKQGGVQ
jgi:hypothetical protein